MSVHPLGKEAVQEALESGFEAADEEQEALPEYGGRRQMGDRLRILRIEN